MTGPTARRLGADEWELNKRLRLAALAEAPYAFTTTLAEAMRRTDDEWRRLTRDRAAAPDSCQLIACVDAEPAGMAACVAHPPQASAEMFAVWVSPLHRRSGVGEALVREAVVFARERGARRMVVGVYDDNTGALGFYRALGFADTGRHKAELAREGRAVLELELTV